MIAYRTNLVVIVPKAFWTYHDQCPVHIRVSHNVHRDFKSERWWTFHGYYFLILDCRFQYHCRYLGCLRLHCHSQKPLPPPPDFQYPMNSPHYYSCSWKYFLHFGSLFPFLLIRLATFLFLIKPLSIPNSASPSRNVFSARGLVTSSL